MEAWRGEAQATEPGQRRGQDVSCPLRRWCPMAVQGALLSATLIPRPLCLGYGLEATSCKCQIDPLQALRTFHPLV